MSDETPAPNPEKPPLRKPRHRWLRRVLIVLLALFLLLAIFHRPLIFEGSRYFIVRAAKQQHLDLTYDIGGSIFSSLYVTRLKAVPTEPGPIDQLEIGTIRLQYSLWGLFRKGLPALLKTVEVKDAFIGLTPGEPLPPEKEEKPQRFKFPALFPEILRIENVNFVSHAPSGDTELAGFTFTLLPDRAGTFAIKTLDIPGVRRWTDISAETTFRDRNLFLRNLIVGPEIAVDVLNLDASRLDDNQLGLGFEGTLFQGRTKLSAKVDDLNDTNKLALRLDVTGLSLHVLSAYLNLALPIQAEIPTVHVAFDGLPEKPDSWTGKVDVALTGVTADAIQAGNVTVAAELGNARAKVAANVEARAGNTIRLNVETALPAKLDGFIETKAQGVLDASLPDLAALWSDSAPVSGGAKLNAEFALDRHLAKIAGTLDSDRVTAGDIEAMGNHFTFSVEKDLQAEGPVFAGSKANLEGGVAATKIGDYSTDQIALAAKTDGAAVRLTQLTVEKSGNRVALEGEYLLPDDLASWTAQPGSAKFHIDAPRLNAFVAPESGTELAGRVKADGQAQIAQGLYSGDLTIEGRDIRAQGVPVRSLDAKIAVHQDHATVSQLSLVVDDRNAITAEGETDLADPFAYHGRLDITLRNLAVFRPLLGPDAPELGGELTARWQGNGTKTAHSGLASLELTNGMYADQRNLAARFNATYTPEAISLPDFRVSSSLASAQFALGWRDKVLSVTNLVVRQQQLTVLSGTLSLPLDLANLQNPDLLIPNDQPVALNLRTDNLDLQRLLSQLGQNPAPVRGMVNMTIAGRGTIDDLEATLALRATGVRSQATPDLAPANLDLNATVRNDRLGLTGELRQPLIQPLRITGDLPLDLVKIRRENAIDPATPIQLGVSLPRSSLAVLSALVPAIRQSRGTAEANVRVEGTFAQPNFSGSMAADLSTLRFTDPSLPPVNDASFLLNFAGNRMTVARCRGGIAGGSFDAGGNVLFAPLDNPTLDLRIGTVNALVMQNDDITARITSNLRITGPLNAGRLAGDVAITRSRFFRNIDILPIGLPGRPAPQPPEEPTIVSFPRPPLRDWTFDVRVRTADPFLIQGNLANGKISVDLRLGGTGLRPWADGVVRVDQLLASLPFSRLDISNSAVFFRPEQPFIPQLDIRGTSAIRDYNVRVTVQGPITAPNAIFTSDPPLPQSEIVSLIATGMTTRELTSDPNAVAGRAAILLFQKAYNSIFRRNSPPANDSFLSRIQFDVGMTDPKTGKQSAGLRIPLSDQLALVGGVDVGGNFRGQVKYLLRFK